MTDWPRVSVHIVTWNSRTHLPSCVPSLVGQTYHPTDIMVVDNGSIDGTVSWLEEHYPQLHVLRNTRNLGFCRAHNQALRLTDAPYVLVLNPDVVLEPDWIARGVAWLNQHPAHGSFGGKLRRYSYSPDELKEVRRSDIIDSAGLQVTRSRHCLDRASGQADSHEFSQDADIFGHSGACCLYRRTALESVRFHDEYFDDDFFAYKDDVDLAWRLQRLGWLSRYDAQALAFHHRHIQGQSSTSDRLIARHHRTRDRFNSYYSYRNHWLLLFKNERWSTLWRDGPWIGWYEAKKIIFLLVRQPRSLAGLTAASRLFGRMRQKARLIDRHAKQTPVELRKKYFLAP